MRLHTRRLHTRRAAKTRLLIWGSRTSPPPPPPTGSRTVMRGKMVAEPNVFLIWIFSIRIERRRRLRGAHAATTFGFTVFIRIERRRRLRGAYTATTFGFIVFVG